MTDADLVMDRLSWNDHDIVAEFKNPDGSPFPCNRLQIHSAEQILVGRCFTKETGMDFKVLRPFMLGNHLITSIQDLIDLTTRFREISKERKEKLAAARDEFYRLDKEFGLFVEDFLATQGKSKS